MINTNAEIIRDLLGEENLIRDLDTAGSEDFHFYKRELGCKAAYLGLGADLSPGLHHKDMTFNKDALYIGVDILLSLIKKRLF